MNENEYKHHATSDIEDDFSDIYTPEAIEIIAKRKSNEKKTTPKDERCSVIAPFFYYDGDKYIYQPCDKAVHQLESLLLIYNQETNSVLSHLDNLIIDTETNEIPILQLKTQPKGFFKGILANDARINISLYKVGLNEPIISHTTTPDSSGEVLDDLECTWKNLQIGGYFLLISNVFVEGVSPHIYPPHHYIFPFYVVKNGEGMPHPKVLKAEFTVVPPDMDPMSERADCVILHLTFEDIFIDGHHFQIFCYNDKLIQISNTEAMVDYQDKRAECYFVIWQHDVWLSGEYFIVICHNKYPFARIDFTISEKNDVIYKVEYIADVYRYKFLLNLEMEKEWSSGLYEIPGCGTVRKHIWNLSDSIAYRRLREGNGLPRLKECSNFILLGKENGFKEDLARSISSFISHYDHFEYVNAFVLIEICSAIVPYEKVIETFNEFRGRTIYIDNPTALVSTNGAIALRALIEEVKKNNGKWTLALGGTRTEIKLFFEQVPELASYFPDNHWFETESFVTSDVMSYIEQELNRYKIELSFPALQKLTMNLAHLEAEGALLNWTLHDIRRFMEQAIIAPMQQRVLKIAQSELEENPELLRSVLDTDLSFPEILKNQHTFDTSMRKLNELIGLKEVKQNLAETFEFMLFNRRRKKMGLPANASSACHMIFTGNPGTGKTTVAKLVGEVCRALGILSNGEVIVTDRAKLVGRYIGETEKNMQELLVRARGKVLFVDEAYTLCDQSSDRKDFGQRVLEAFLPVLAEDDSDMVVIFAGYEREMNVMLETNIGLKGRFPYQFNFQDFSAEELILIADNILNKKSFVFTSEARKKWIEIIKKGSRYRSRFFSNARWVTQLVLNDLLPVMARRVVKDSDNISPTFYQTIEEMDIVYVEERMNLRASNERIRKPVGYNC